jgi:hypothetical protein
MSDKIIHIEKYDINSYEKQQKPYAMILTDVIQRIPSNRIQEGFLWIFLESLPPTWKPNKYHIMQHFNISERTYIRWMSWLNTVKLIEYRQNRFPGGSFGKGDLIVLSGTQFNVELENKGTVKIGGTVVNKKKDKVIHNFDDHRTAKFGGTVKPSTARTSTEDSSFSPNSQKTVSRQNAIHINKTIKDIKDIKKTNNDYAVFLDKPITPPQNSSKASYSPYSKTSAPFVSVFSDTQSVKDHLERVIANRQDPVDEDLQLQGIYYAFETNPDKSFDSVNKRLNIFLKKIRQGLWLIPQGYNGITSQSIRDKEIEDQLKKREQYQQEALAYRLICTAKADGSGYKGFMEAFSKLKLDNQNLVSYHDLKKIGAP